MQFLVEFCIIVEVVKLLKLMLLVMRKFIGRVCAPSGASVGKFEAVSFPNNSPEESLSILNQNSE